MTADHPHTTDARAALAQQKAPDRGPTRPGQWNLGDSTMSADHIIAQTADNDQEAVVRDPLAAKLRAVGFFTPPTQKITPEQADALAPAPSWADRPDYERDWEDQDGGFWITEKATISVTDTARVAMVRETAITGTGVVAHMIESVRVGHAGEEFWIETRHVEAVFAQIRSAATEAGVTL